MHSVSVRRTVPARARFDVIVSNHTPVIMGIVTDPEELARARAQDERFERNWAWFTARATEIYRAHRGKCYCVAGEELFVGDTPQEVLAMATAAHPADDGRFTGYIPKEKMARIYAHRRHPARV
jgi:hypothetical protein